MTGHNSDSPTNPPAAESAHDKVRRLLGDPPEGADVRSKLGDLPEGVDVRSKLGELPEGVDVRAKLGDLPDVSAKGFLAELGLLREPEPSGFDKAAAVLGDFLPPTFAACPGSEICAAVRRQQDQAVAADALADGPEHDAASSDAYLAFSAVALMPAADVLGVAAKLALLLRDLASEEGAADQHLDLLSAAIADLLAIGGAAPLEPTAEDPGQGGAP